MKALFTGLVFLFSIGTFSQTDCNCEENFKWVKETFEENDAGFAFVIEQKGMDAYTSHSQKFMEKVRSINNTSECVEAISEFLAFFRKGHVSVRSLNPSTEPETSSKQTDEEIIRSFADWETYSVDIDEFRQYLKSKKNHDYEGIWVRGSYEIGIKKAGKEYIGFIISADGVYWREGQVKLRIKEDNSTIFYFKDHTPRTFQTIALSNNYIILDGYFALERKYPALNAEPGISRYLKAFSSPNPYFERISTNTCYLRIPSFSSNYKAKIDSVIDKNREQILSAPNLIIDLRANGGGSDQSYRELIPFLYTNPIRVVGTEFLSTPLNNQRMLDIEANNNFGEDTKKWARKSYDILSEHIGEFVGLSDESVYTTERDTVYPYPSNIGILINRYNGSTTEQFLLAAKQSKKVKLFGTTTMGVLDISNMNFVQSPTGEIQLGYGISRSLRIPDMAIDGKGILPDYYIDKEIPIYQWISYTESILNNSSK